MKILSISLDKNLFKEDSEVRQRQIEYGGLCDALHVLVLYPGKDAKISSNVWIYAVPGQNRFFRLRAAFKKAKKIVLENKIGLVSSQDPFFSALIGWLIRKKFKIPWQIQVHTDFLSPYFWRESTLSKVRVLLAKFLIPRANCIRVVSQRIKNSLNSKFKILNSKIFVLPIFVDVEAIRQAPIKTDLHKKYPQFDFIILMASRLTKEKNIGLVIELMREIIKKYPRTGLIIVGDGPEKKNCELRIANCELKDNVIMENWTDDLISYYKAADLFLLTSNYEGYGRTIIEAVVSGCNVISSDVGIAGEILSKDNIFEPGNKEQLKERIIKAIKGNLSKTELLTKMIKEKYLEEYKKSWQKCKNIY